MYKRGASSLDQGDVVGLCVFPRRKVPFGPMFSNRCLPSHDNHTLSILFKRARAPHIVAPLGHVKDFDPIGIAHRCTVLRDTRYVLQLALQRSTSPAKGCTIKELLYKRNTDPTRRKEGEFRWLYQVPICHMSRIERTRRRGRCVPRLRRLENGSVDLIWR